MGTGSQQRRARARDLSEAVAVERGELCGQLFRAVDGRGGANAAVASVEAGEERAGRARDRGGVRRHPRIDLVRVERAGDRLGGALQPQLLARPAALRLQQRGPLERHCREVRERLDRRAAAPCRAGAARSATRPRALPGMLPNSPRTGHTIRTPRAASPRRRAPSRSSPASIASISSGAACHASTRGSSSVRPRTSRLIDASSAWRSSSVANHAGGCTCGCLAGLGGHERHGRDGQDGARVLHHAGERALAPGHGRWGRRALRRKRRRVGHGGVPRRDPP